jgi:phage-related baseplate assembly protein
MRMIPEIARLPDISFIDDISLDDIKVKMITDYQDKFKEITGQAVTLKEGEPITLMLYACAVQIFQMYLNVDKAGKMNFLKYAYGDFLDNLGALKGVSRQNAAPASCTVRFRLSAIRASVVAIPQGTRVTTQDAEMYFATDEYAEIPVGSEYVDVPCTALTEGEAGNNYGIGDIDVIVDPIPYVATCTNLTAASGGAARESDDNFADRIYLAPESYSVAGPEAAYVYFTKLAYPGVEDVKVSSPSECEVDIRVIGPNGTLLSNEILQRIEDYISSAEIKPLTDHVTVSSPTISSYNINFTYYINRSESFSVASIQERVTKAVDEYIAWQAGRIGRDIEPNKLIEYVMAAGAKRVVVTYPAYTVVGATAIPQVGTKTITYGGLQDD